jgi:excisionase family DNA binding protein
VPVQPRRLSGPLTTAEAASKLGVDLRVVQRALRKGYLHGEKVGNAWVIPEAALAQLAVAGPHPFRGIAPSHPTAWMPSFMSATAAAHELGVTDGYVGTLVRRGRLEGQRVGVWLAVSEGSVARFAEQRRPVEEDAESGEIRRLILGGTCPWCGRTNLLVPARHVTSRHGIDRRALRRLMGVRARTSICAPEQTERRRQHNLRPERLAQLRTLTPWEETRGTRRPAPATRPSTPRPGPAASAASGRKRIDPPQRERILAQREAGMPFRTIAEEEDISEVTVLRICRGHR